jgi:hypothetical protein
MRRCLTAALVLALPLAAGHEAATQTLPRPKAEAVQGKVVPKLEPVAETRLLMEGLAHPNFRGAERHLREKPAGLEQWTFLRGQALLMAETANLLMLRPPRSQGQPAWFERSAELRATARKLAEAASARNFEGSRAALVQVANACNRCHQSFRSPVEIVPFADPGGGE